MPSAFLVAVVFRLDTSLPANASLIAKHISFFPVKTSGTTLALTLEDPKLSTGGRPMVPPLKKPIIIHEVCRKVL